MMKKIAIGIFAAVVLLIVVAAFQPSDFRTSRSVNVSASSSEVFEHVNNLHKWEAWSPWDKMDPNMTRTYNGPESGVGASFGWSGNSEVGEGRSTIVESRPLEVIKFKLEMKKPFEATNDVEFTFKPDGENVLVSWTMMGKKNLIMKAVGLFLDCDKMVGEQFEKGLSQLKTVVESSK